MKQSINILLKIATNDQDFKDAERLFREYADSLNIDLAFQNFENEIKSINVQYSKPKGALILAYNSNKAIGCVGVRRIDEDTAELKRMFVQPQFRGQKIAQRMLDMAINVAQNFNYKRIRLDTIPGMASAQRLYLSNSFYEIAPYRFNPVEGTIYMEKKLL